MLCVLAALLVLGVVGLGVLGSMTNSTDQSNGVWKVDPNKVLLQQASSADSSLSYGAVNVVDACNLFTLNDFNATGLKPYLNEQLTHSTVDGAVSADKAVGKNASDPVSSCKYPIDLGAQHSSFGTIEIEVLQSPFNKADEIASDKQVPQGAEVHTVSSVTWYRKDQVASPTSWRFIVSDSKQPGVDVRLTFSSGGTDGDSVENSPIGKVVNAAAGQVATNLAKGPQGQAKFSYQDPLANIPSACDLASSDVVEAMSKAPDWHWRSEGYDLTAATGESVNTQCTRMSDPERQRGPSDNGPLRYLFLITTGQSAAVAADLFHMSCAAAAQKMDQKIGDEPPCLVTGPAGVQMIFRVGRVIANISVIDQNDMNTAIQMLTPGAQLLAKKMTY